MGTGADLQITIKYHLLMIATQGDLRATLDHFKLALSGRVAVHMYLRRKQGQGRGGDNPSPGGFSLQSGRVGAGSETLGKDRPFRK